MHVWILYWNVLETLEQSSPHFTIVQRKIFLNLYLLIKTSVNLWKCLCQTCIIVYNCVFHCPLDYVKRNKPIWQSEELIQQKYKALPLKIKRLKQDILFISVIITSMQSLHSVKGFPYWTIIFTTFSKYLIKLILKVEY